MAKKYKVVLSSGYGTAINTTAAIDHVYPVGCGNASPTNAANEIRMRTHLVNDGKLKNFRLFFSTRNLPSDITWVLWKNGVATSATITVPLGIGGGYFSNDTVEITVANGDYFQWRMIAPITGTAKQFNLQSLECDYETTECVTRYTTASNSVSAIAVNAAPTYMNFTTSKATTTSLTDNFRLVVPATGFIRLCIYVTANTRSQFAELYLNVNAVRQTGTFIAIPNATTGFFVSDPIAVTQGDIIVADIDVSGGTGNLSYVENGFFYYNNQKTYMAVSSGLTVLGNTTERFYRGFGVSGANATLFSDRIVRLRGTGKIRNLYQLVYSNTATTVGTVRIVKGGVGTTLSASIPIATNTVISNLVDEVTYADTDNFTLGTQRSGSTNASAGVTSFEIVPDGVGGMQQAAWFM